MKKRLMILGLILCLLLAGCGGGDNPIHSNGEPSTSKPSKPGQDAQNQYLSLPIVDFQEGEDFFFGSDAMSNFLHYYDTNSGVSGILCADPSCAHDSDECGGYRGVSSVACLAYYDGMRYWVAPAPQGEGTDFYLWRSKLSGEEREKVKRLGYKDIFLTYQPQRFMIHRGNLYFFGRANVVEDSGANFRITLMVSPLDDTEAFTPILDEKTALVGDLPVRFVGDNVYFAMTSNSALTEGAFDVRVLKYDTTAHTTETVYEKSGIEEALDELWVTEAEEIYLSGSSNHAAFVWKLENGKLVEIASWEGEDWSAPDLVDGILVQYSREEGVLNVEIKDLSGNTVYDGPCFPNGIPGLEGDPNECIGFCLVGGDADKIIMLLEGERMNHTVMLDLKDNMRPTLLWSSADR